MKKLKIAAALVLAVIAAAALLSGCTGKTPEADETTRTDTSFETTESALEPTETTEETTQPVQTETGITKDTSSKASGHTLTDEEEKKYKEELLNYLDELLDGGDED